MQQNLVIVESPAKAKTIEKFLGKDFTVMSSFGHIRDLQKADMGLDLETFQPLYEIPADKAKVVAELRAKARKADTVWLASDEDREGEAISWHLAEVLHLDPATARRIVFHEITKPAILEAIAHPRTIDLHLVDAQQARRVLDRLVGFKLSPVLWRKVRPSLSAGRVQSVTVRLIVEREREIAAFQSESSYRVTGHFVLPSAGGATLKAELSHRFPTREEAEAFLQHCRTAGFTIADIQTKPTKRTPAPPFTTSTLQQEAARKLGFSVAATMRVAQSLYEAGLITYMRTDSMNLSQLCLNTVEPVIKEQMGEAYHQRRNYHTKSKGAQEAHEAIRPTDMRRSKIEGTGQEQRLYNLIWKRTVACQMADAQLEKTTATLAVSDSSHHFIATGEVVKFDGFLRVYRESREDTTESESNDEGRLLPPMTKGERVERAQIVAQERFSLPPARYSEASLVHKLEELGIGRPSTYAPTISTIQNREYVRKGENDGIPRTYRLLTLDADRILEEECTENTGSDKGKLVPTDVGIVVNDFLLQSFPEIMDYNFTAHIEEEFDLVAEGQKDWTQLIRSFYADLDPQVARVMEERTESRIGERQLGTEPQSGRAVSAKIGRYGPMIQIGGSEDDEEAPRFAKLGKNQSIATITLEEALELFKLPRILGDFEDRPVKVNTGRFGPYIQHASKFTSIPKDEDPMTIGLDRAIELIIAKREEQAKQLLRTFSEEPTLEVRAGRFGPYIVFEGMNYRIPKTQHEHAAELSLEECRQIIAGQEPTGRSKGKAKTKAADTQTETKPKTKAKTAKTKASTGKTTAKRKAATPKVESDNA